MSLPMDISTALWWRSVPVWEWESLPPPPPATEAGAPEGGAPPSHVTGPCAPTATTAAPTPEAKPGSERDGYRLVFKGYEVSASLFWYPADSALSRPWLRHDEPPAGHRPRTDGDDAAARAALLQRAGEDSGDQPT